MATAPTTHRAFGLRLRCAFPLPELPTAAVDHVDAALVLAPETVVRATFSGPCDSPATHVGRVGEGETFRIERGLADDHLVELTGHAWFHLDDGARTIACAPVDEADPVWRRFLLDTVLTTAALVHGFEAFHAAAFVRGDRAVAIMGDEGAGKSTLLAAALSAGAGFLCDDIVCVARDPVTTEHLAQPAPPLMNLPPVLPDGSPADGFGQVLARFGDEHWVAVRDAVVRPCALAVFIELDRSGDRLDVEQLTPSPALLLRHSLTGGRGRHRLRARFALCSDLADRLALVRVTARPNDPALAVLDALEPVLSSLLPTVDLPAR